MNRRLDLGNSLQPRDLPTILDRVRATIQPDSLGQRRVGPGLTLMSDGRLRESGERRDTIFTVNELSDPSAFRRVSFVLAHFLTIDELGPRPEVFYFPG